MATAAFAVLLVHIAAAYTQSTPGHPQLPATLTLRTEAWNGEEDVSLNVDQYNHVDADEWQTLNVISSATGQHAQYMRGDRFNTTLYMLIGPPGNGQVCLSKQLPPQQPPQAKTVDNFLWVGNSTVNSHTAYHWRLPVGGAFLSIYSNPKDNTILRQAQSNTGFLLSTTSFSPKCGKLEIPAACQDPVALGEGVEEEPSGRTQGLAHPSLPFPTAFRMDPALVLALKREFGDRAGARGYWTSQVPLRDLPAQLDRRATNNVARVRNQGVCGSCWAFSSAASIETVLSVSTGKPPVSLSPQAVLDCTRYEGSRTNVKLQSARGCGGGWPPSVFQNAVNGTGIPSEEAYPYTGVEVMHALPHRVAHMHYMY